MLLLLLSKILQLLLTLLVKYPRLFQLWSLHGKLEFKLLIKRYVVFVKQISRVKMFAEVIRSHELDLEGTYLSRHHIT